MIMPDNNNSDRDCFVNCLLGCIFTWSGSSSYVNDLYYYTSFIRRLSVTVRLIKRVYYTIYSTLVALIS
jgi:hypothetical protein